MKYVKLLLIIGVMLGTSLSLQAHKVKIYPRHGTVVTKVYHPSVVTYEGINFYYAKGVWYKPYGRKYIVCRAPAGIRIKYMPRGYKIVRVNGKKYYSHNGTLFIKKRGFYTVVRVR